MNKSKLIKVLILLLVLLMLVPYAAACKKDDTPDADSSDVSESTPNEDGSESSKYDVADGLGDITLNGRTIRIAYVEGMDYDSEVDVNRLSGDVVADDVYRRNIAVEKRLNATIQGVAKGGGIHGAVNSVSEAVLAGLPADHDFGLAPSYTVCGLITQGLYNDLNDVPNLDLSRTYWAQFLNDTYDVGGVQYSASGAISLSFYKFVFVTLINDTMLKTKSDAPDLVKVVKDGRWTIEYHTQLIKDYYVNKGDSGKDDEDILGFVGATGIDLDAYISSGDLTILKKGDDGFYSYQFDLAKATAIMDDIVALYNSSATFAYTSDDMEELAMKKFSKGEALSTTSRLIELESADMKMMKDEYTILPVPRLNEDQEAYYSLISDRFTSVYVPVTVKGDDLWAVGAMMEALAAESYRRVVPTYLETVLRTRFTSSPEKWQIMNDIMSNVKMDACLPFTNTLAFDGEPRPTIVRLWRYTGWKGYTDGANPPISSVFNSGVETKMEEKLNGENGLQTLVKKLLENKTAS